MEVTASIRTSVDISGVLGVLERITVVKLPCYSMDIL